MENMYNSPKLMQEIFQTMDFYAKYPNIRLFTGKKVYSLHENVRALLQQNHNNPDEQQKLHGNFIWNLKKYYRTSFRKEAVALVNSNIKELNLSDKDKINYLNYLLSTSVYPYFHDSVFEKLSQVDFSNSVQKLQAKNVFEKLKTLLTKKQKNKVENMQLFHKFEPFLQNFAQQSQAVSYKMLGEFAEVYFNAGLQSEYREISMQPLVMLMQKTEALQAQKTPQLFEKEFSNQALSPKIDKKAVTVLLKGYYDFWIKSGKSLHSNSNFHHAVTSMFCDIVQNFDYTATDVKNLRKVLGNHRSFGAQQARLYEMGLLIQRAYNQSHSRGVSSRNKTVHPIFKDKHTRWD